MSFNLRKNSANFALKSLVKHGDTNIFPVPFEYSLMDESSVDYICANPVSRWETAQSCKFLTAKEKGGFRLAALLDPMDTLFYSSLIIDGGDLMESNVKISKGISFSGRFLKDSATLKFLSNDYQGFINKSLVLAGQYAYILKADIADFFNRVYLHDLETSIRDVSDQDYALAIGNFLKQLNTLITVGCLPVGTEASIFLSNILLTDLDNSLLAANIKFCRFMDDFVIAANTEQELYRNLYILSDVLMRRYHLNLQSRKTEIYISSAYQDYRNGQSEGFMEDINKFYEQNFANPYEDVIFEDLPKEQQDIISRIGLDVLLEEALAEPVVNLTQVKRIINFSRHLTYLNTFDILMGNLDKVYPIIDVVMRYLQGIADSLNISDKDNVKNQLLNLLLRSVHLSHIPFYKVWILDTLRFYKGTFTNGDIQELAQSYDSQDPFTKRQTILLLGELKSAFWFRNRKDDFHSMDSWQKRAFLKGLNDCGLSAEEIRPFIKGIKSTIALRDSYIFRLPNLK